MRLGSALISAVPSPALQLLLLPAHAHRPPYALTPQSSPCRLPRRWWPQRCRSRAPLPGTTCKAGLTSACCTACLASTSPPAGAGEAPIPPPFFRHCHRHPRNNASTMPAFAKLNDLFLSQHDVSRCQPGWSREWLICQLRLLLHST
jgi:hypothetical protein